MAHIDLNDVCLDTLKRQSETDTIERKVKVGLVHAPRPRATSLLERMSAFHPKRTSGSNSKLTLELIDCWPAPHSMRAHPTDIAISCSLRSYRDRL